MPSYNPTPTTTAKSKIIDENLPEKDWSSITPNTTNNNSKINSTSTLDSINNTHQTNIDSYLANSTNLTRPSIVGHNSSLGTTVLSRQFNQAEFTHSTEYYGVNNRFAPGYPVNNNYLASQQLYVNQPQLPHYIPDSRILTNTLNGLDLNGRSLGPIGGAMLSTTNPTSVLGPNLYTPNSSLPNHHLHYRNSTELERMKMKCQALEQQRIGNYEPSIFPNRSSSLTSSSSDINRLNELEFNAAMLRNEITSKEAMEIQIQKLDKILNEREYEIFELKKKLAAESSKFEKELTKCKSMIKSRDDDILNEKTKYMNLQKESDKLKTKLNECNDYMAKLPTLDEVDESKKNFDKLLKENTELLDKLKDSDKKILKAKTYIKEKHDEIAELQNKLELADLEKGKIQLEFDNFKKASQNIGELLERCEENSRLTAELDSAKKFINSLQEKSKLSHTKHANEVNELEEKLSLENDVSESLRKILADRDGQIIKLEKKIKEMGQKNQNLLSETLNLSEKCKSLEVLVSPDSLKLLQMLFKELNLCKNDLESLVKNCIDIYQGHNVDICSLLGVSNSNRSAESIDLSNNELIDSLANTDFLIKRTNELKDIRKKLTEVRKMVSDEYAEKVGSNMSCITQ